MYVLQLMAQSMLEPHRGANYMTITRSTGTVVSILAALAGLASITDLLPERIRPWVAGIAGVAALINQQLAHRSNPDGTPVEVAYMPSDKKG